MKNVTYIIVLFSLFSIISCKEKDKEATLNLAFKTNFGNQELILNNEYIDSKGYKYRFEGFRYFLSNITLVKEDNSEVKLTDLTCVDLATPSTLELKRTNFVKTRYKKIKFGVGLTPEQNNVLPDDAPAGDARQSYSFMYWGWLKYIFVKIDGRSDVDGSGNFQNLLIYHIGTDDLYKTVEIEKSFEVVEGENTIKLTLDALKIFENGVDDIDISDYEQSYTHSDKSNSKNYNTALKFAENFSKAFSAI